MLIIFEGTLLIKLKRCDCSGWAFCRIHSTQEVYIHRTKGYLFASLWSSSWNCSGWWQVCVNCFMWLCRNTVHISNTTVDRHRADKTRVSVILILKWRNAYINGINTVSYTQCVLNSVFFNCTKLIFEQIRIQTGKNTLDTNAANSNYIYL